MVWIVLQFVLNSSDYKSEALALSVFSDKVTLFIMLGLPIGCSSLNIFRHHLSVYKV